jgi:hypothetical protein
MPARASIGRSRKPLENAPINIPIGVAVTIAITRPLSILAESNNQAMNPHTHPDSTDWRIEMGFIRYVSSWLIIGTVADSHFSRASAIA